MAGRDTTLAVHTDAVPDAASRLESASQQAADALNRYGPAVQALAAQALAPSDDEHIAAIKQWLDQPLHSLLAAIPNLSQNFGTIKDDTRVVTDTFGSVDQTHGRGMADIADRA